MLIHHIAIAGLVTVAGCSSPDPVVVIDEPPSIVWREGGNLMLEYVHFDTELQAMFKLPAGVTTASRVTAYFMDSQTPQANPLPSLNQCSDLVATKGWPQYVGSPHVDLDLGALTISGKNTAGSEVTSTVPKMAMGVDQLGRPHDIFYQSFQPDAAAFLKPDSAYTIQLSGAGTIPFTAFVESVFLAEDFTVNSPDLEDNGPLIAGAEFPVRWSPAVSSNRPPPSQLVGGEVYGVTWLVDIAGAPTHMCVVNHSAGQFTIPGTAIAEYQAIARARSLPANKMILLRDALVHQLVELPNREANNQRRIDMLGLVGWAQLMDVQ